MYTKQSLFFGKEATLACDGKCSKAWGIHNRPKENFDKDDPDDYAYFADDELGDAPANPGTYEGDEAKPSGPHEMNRWCARECERSMFFLPGQPVILSDFSQRIFNQPRKHTQSDGNCPKCNKKTEYKHMHDCAHGISETHVAGSERYECRECGYALYKTEGEKQGLCYILD